MANRQTQITSTRIVAVDPACLQSVKRSTKSQPRESTIRQWTNNRQEDFLFPIQASRDTRMAEHALVRALGGSRRLIAGSLAGEFAALGLFAGVIAAFGSELTVAILQVQIFELPMQIHPWLWLIAPLAGSLLILLVGLFGTRSLVSAPPMLVLRGLN